MPGGRGRSTRSSHVRTPTIRPSSASRFSHATTRQISRKRTTSDDNDDPSKIQLNAVFPSVSSPQSSSPQSNLSTTFPQMQNESTTHRRSPKVRTRPLSADTDSSFQLLSRSITPKHQIDHSENTEEVSLLAPSEETKYDGKSLNTQKNKSTGVIPTVSSKKQLKTFSRFQNKNSSHTSSNKLLQRPGSAGESINRETFEAGTSIFKKRPDSARRCKSNDKRTKESWLTKEKHSKSLKKHVSRDLQLMERKALKALCDFYQMHDPTRANISKAKSILTKFKNRELMLYDGLCKKYGSAPQAVADLGQSSGNKLVVDTKQSDYVEQKLSSTNSPNYNNKNIDNRVIEAKSRQFYSKASSSTNRKEIKKDFVRTVDKNNDINKKSKHKTNPLNKKKKKHENYDSDSSLMPYQIGSQMEGRFRCTSKWMICTIQHANRDGTFDVQFTDGTNQSFLKPKDLRVKQSKAMSYHSKSVVKSPTHLRQIQQKALVDFFIRKRVTESNNAVSKAREQLRYFRGKEHELYKKLMRKYGAAPRILQESCNRSDHKKVLCSNSDYSSSDVSIKYCMSRDKSVLSIGEKIEMKYHRRGKIYKGKVTRIRSASKFDILFENGDTDKNIDISMVKKIFKIVHFKESKNSKKHESKENKISSNLSISSSGFNSTEYTSCDDSSSSNRSNSSDNHNISDNYNSSDNYNQETTSSSIETSDDSCFFDGALPRKSEHVEVFRSNGKNMKWFKGVVIEEYLLHKNSSDSSVLFDILYNNGMTEFAVPAASIRLCKPVSVRRLLYHKKRQTKTKKLYSNIEKASQLKRGMRVFVYCQHQWVPGKIAHVYCCAAPSGSEVPVCIKACDVIFRDRIPKSKVSVDRIRVDHRFRKKTKRDTYVFKRNISRTIEANANLKVEPRSHSSIRDVRQGSTPLGYTKGQSKHSNIFDENKSCSHNTTNRDEYVAYISPPERKYLGVSSNGLFSKFQEKWIENSLNDEERCVWLYSKTILPTLMVLPTLSETNEKQPQFNALLNTIQTSASLSNYVEVKAVAADLRGICIICKTRKDKQILSTFFSPSYNSADKSLIGKPLIVQGHVIRLCLIDSSQLSFPNSSFESMNDKGYTIGTKSNNTDQIQDNLMKNKTTTNKTQNKMSP